MRAMFAMAVLGLTGLLAGTPADAADAHSPAAHDAAPASAASSAKFDEKTALAINQAVLGKPLGDYTFTASDGRMVRLADFRGKPLVISLVYTSCYHICPMTTQHLAQVVRTARAALGDDSFSVLTIGFDTPNDTPAAMRRFALDQGVDMPHWRFLSADAATMAGLTKDLGFIANRAPHGFDHLIVASVIDPQGRVYRQVYGMNFDTPLLVEPLKELVFGAPVAPSLLTHLGNRIRLFCTVYDPTTDRYRFDYSIFMGIIIGFSIIATVSFLVIREWLRNRLRARA
jgi:protein SCO1/2